MGPLTAQRGWKATERKMVGYKSSGQGNGKRGSLTMGRDVNTEGGMRVK